MVGTRRLVWGPWAIGGAWFAAALALYWLTAASGPVWADPSKLTLYALRGYFPSLNPGDHAAWTVLAWGWLHLVGGDPVLAAHRLSAVCGALVVALATLVVRTRGGDEARAHTVATLFLVSLPLWWASAVAETYALALAATFGGALVLGTAPRGWRWWLGGGLWGLAVATHAMSVFLVAPLAWESGRGRAWRILPAAVLGAAPAWLAVFGGPLDPLTGFAAGGASTWRWHWGAFVAVRRAPFNAAVLAGLLAYALGFAGLYALWRGRREPRGSRAWVWSLGALSLLLLTYAPYRLHLMATFLVAGLLLALPVRLPGWARLGHVVFQVVVYLAVPAALTVAGRQNLGVRVLPNRNNAFYFLSPIKSVHDGAAGTRDVTERAPASPRGRWLTSLRRALDPGTDAYLAGFGACVPAPTRGVVLADFNTGAVLRLAQVARGWRPELDVRPVAVDVALAASDPPAALAGEVERLMAVSGEVWLADSYAPYYHTHELAALFHLSPCGTAVRVMRKDPQVERVR